MWLSRFSVAEMKTFLFVHTDLVKIRPLYLWLYPWRFHFFPMAFFMSLSNIDCSSFLGRFWYHCFLSSSDLLRLLWTVYILQMELILISIFPLPVSAFGTAWELNRVLWGWLSLWLCPLCFLICHVTPSPHPTPRHPCSVLQSSAESLLSGCIILHRYYIQNRQVLSWKTTARNH